MSANWRTHFERKLECISQALHLMFKERAKMVISKEDAQFLITEFSIKFTNAMTCQLIGCFIKERLSKNTCENLKTKTLIKLKDKSASNRMSFGPKCHILLYCLGSE